MAAGYDDTPFLPGGVYRVHDKNRPQPKVVAPASFEQPFAPPSDAIVLFDGRDLTAWKSCKDGGPAAWKVENGYMEVVPKTGNICTRADLGDIQLHLEFASPAEVVSEGQGRGNSGVFLMRMYEVQVLDCYQNPTYADGTTGALYGQCPPLVNACRKPGEWQTYDIIWEGPRFEAGRLVRPARITVIHNGVLLHHAKELQGPTQHKKLAAYVPHPPAGPLELQDHNNPVRFRNIWYRPLKDYDQP
ncbi:MAG TPA: DUF1080 domain-containing protein [Candidatus Brocadiia bacterium]|nr:DUF1080 domain-containing protein [Candidatus Brocadiia bacterium]